MTGADSASSLEASAGLDRPVNPRAPGWPLLLAAVTFAVALGLVVVGSATASFVGWLIGAIGTSAAVVTYRVGDRRASQSARYVRDRRQSRLANILLLAGIAVGAVNAFLFATEVAK